MTIRTKLFILSLRKLTETRNMTIASAVVTGLVLAPSSPFSGGVLKHLGNILGQSPLSILRSVPSGPPEPPLATSEGGLELIVSKRFPSEDSRGRPNLLLVEFLPRLSLK